MPAALQVCRALVLGSNLLIAAAATWLVVLGSYTLSPSAGGLDDLLVNRDALIWGSIGTGIALLVFSLVGCVGAFKKKGGALCCHALLMLVVLGFASACAAVLIRADGCASTAEEYAFDVSALRQAGKGRAANFVEDVYSSFAIVASACGADAALLAPVSTMQPYNASVVCSADGMRSFASWATDKCLGTEADWSGSRLSAFESCAAELDEAMSDEDVPLGQTSRLFCACPDALVQSLREHKAAAYSTSVASAIFILLLLVCAMGTRKLAAKAKKQKHTRLEAAEGFFESDSAARRGDDVYIA